MSVSGYTDRRLKTWLHQYVVSLSRTLHPHCFSRLSCEMSIIWEHPGIGCLFSAMSFSREMAHKSGHLSKNQYEHMKPDILLSNIVYVTLKYNSWHLNKKISLLSNVAISIQVFNNKKLHVAYNFNNINFYVQVQRIWHL